MIRYIRRLVLGQPGPRLEEIALEDAKMDEQLRCASKAHTDAFIDFSMAASKQRAQTDFVREVVDGVLKRARVKHELHG